MKRHKKKTAKPEAAKASPVQLYPLRPRVLILDDQTDTLHMMAKHLERTCEVHTASTLTEARNALRDPAFFSVFVTDMRCGDGDEDGLQLARELGQRVIRPEVIVVTGYGDLENANLCMQAGVFAYIEKEREFYTKLCDACREADRRWRLRFVPDNAPMATESLVMLDLVESTRTTVLKGYDAVAKNIINALRQIVVYTAPQYSLHCLRSTGDGYFLAFRAGDDSEESTLDAIGAVLAISNRVREYNATAKKDLRIELRFALHFGEVAVFDGDRSGREVAYIHRMEKGKQAGIASGTPVPSAIQRMKTDYAILSQHFLYALTRFHDLQHLAVELQAELSGFSGIQRLYFVDNISSALPNFQRGSVTRP